MAACAKGTTVSYFSPQCLMDKYRTFERMTYFSHGYQYIGFCYLKFVKMESLWW